MGGGTSKTNNKDQDQKQQKDDKDQKDGKKDQQDKKGKDDSDSDEDQQKYVRPPLTNYSRKGVTLTYKELAIELLYEHNRVREDPKSLITQLEQRIQSFEGLLFRREGQTTIQTQQGIAPLKELINVLKQTEPMTELEWQPHLVQCAYQHIYDLATNNLTGHTGSDGSTPVVRMEKYGKIKDVAAENISYTHKTGRDIIMQLLIDDGVEKRGHRNTILNKKLKKIGISIGQHNALQLCTVINYTGDFIPVKSSTPLPIQFNDELLVEDKIFEKIQDYQKSSLAIYQYINKVRADPRSIIPILESRLPNFRGMVYTNPDNTFLKTKEGAQAVQELINYLQGLSPLEPLKMHEWVTRAALDHAHDLYQSGFTGQEGSDGSNTFTRLERYGKWLKEASENITFGLNSAEEAVLTMLIDDGVGSRVHRKSFFKEVFTLIGIAGMDHPKFSSVFVIDLVGGFMQKDTDEYKKLVGLLGDDQILTYKQLSKRIFEMLNQCRTKPKSIIDMIYQYQNELNQNKINVDEHYELELNQGSQGLDNLIEFLQNQQPVSKLIWSQHLSLVAYDLAVYSGAQGYEQDEALQDKDLQFRYNKYLFYQKEISLPIQISINGPIKPKDFLILLLLQDGQEIKSNRSIIFSQKYQYVGLSSSSHQAKRNCAYFMFCENHKPRDDELPEKSYQNEQVKLQFQQAVGTSTDISVSSPPILPKDDPDKPAGTLKTTVQQFTKIVGDQKIITITQTFHLNDGTTKVVSKDQEE